MSSIIARLFCLLGVHSFDSSPAIAKRKTPAGIFYGHRCADCGRVVFSNVKEYGRYK